MLGVVNYHLYKKLIYVYAKTALDWIVERQAVTTDKTSDIVNDWAIPHHAQPEISVGTDPAHHYRIAGNHEDRQGIAGTGHLSGHVGNRLYVLHSACFAGTSRLQNPEFDYHFEIRTLYVENATSHKK